MSRLRPEEFIPHAPSSTGTVRLNHNSPSCVGSSKSLKIERKEDGSISAICYRCSARGYRRHSGQKYKQAKAKARSAASGLGIHGHDNEQQFQRARTCNIPADCAYRVAEWGIRARQWLNKATLTREEVEKYGILYSRTRDSVYIPVPPSGWTVRCFSPQWTGPKYVSYVPSSERSVINGGSNEALCIVEDMLSAIVVARVIDSLPLAGTYLSDETINNIKGKYSTFYVFLDDDNRQVKMRQLRIAKKLELYGNVNVIRNIGSDPKALSEQQLRNILCQKTSQEMQVDT